MMYVVEMHTFRCKKSVLLGGRRVEGCARPFSAFVTSPYSVVLCGVVEVEQVLIYDMQGPQFPNECRKIA